MSGSLRHRKPGAAESQQTGSASEAPAKSSIVYGKTPDGTVFPVPTTHDVLTALFHPSYPKSHLDILNLALLGAQLVAFWFLPRATVRTAFLLYFAFWRLAYNLGLGIVLTKQSKRRWMVKQVRQRGWLDPARRPAVRNWIRKQLQGKMGADYKFDDLPLEYNTWLLFRQLVDIILLNDFLAYCMFAFASFRVPTDLHSFVHALRWIGGIFLIVFNLWVKTEAHHVVKDYGWYWGDVFFERGALIFDGVFEMAPHPMYSVGYAGYYGLSMIVGSYPVLFASLAAHAAQFAFLNFFENPHIARTYGQRKPLSARTPIQEKLQSPVVETDAPPHRRAESESDTATAVVSESEADGASDSECTFIPDRERPRSPKRAKRKMSQHDLLNKYFHKDPVGLLNLDLFRASDFKLVLVVLYAGVAVLGSSLPQSAIVPLHFVHALAWRCFHSFVLGYILKAQSQSKFLVRHFLKHYYYPTGQGDSGAVNDAFDNWKEVYNLSTCMIYVSFFGMAWQSYVLTPDWTAGDQLLRHTLGMIMIFLHIWTAIECYSVLGLFGWFFGDFFIDDFPTTLEYTGIYRYLNNPERTASGAALFGLALMSSSKLVFFAAVVSHISHGWFITNVETPHMRKLYGDNVRGDAGLTRMLKKLAKTNARLLEAGAGKHAPELKRRALEMKETLEKVMGDTTEAMDQLLAKSRPMIEEVMNDTKILLQQSRERMVIPRVARDITQYDLTMYKMTIVPSPLTETLRFHLGEPIEIAWQAPANHSRKDWIGIYRVGANSSTLVTQVSSLGLWLPVYAEEWQGDTPRIDGDGTQYGAEGVVSGRVTFAQDKLPMTPEKYELRYHHDGKHNVMSIVGPVEIYLAPPPQLEFAHVRAWLLQIVRWCLNNDPLLIPASCGQSTPTGEESAEQDDFRFWNESQAERIASIIHQAVGVEYTAEVIIADANVTSLSRRIIASKRLLEQS
ncbi:phosphatidylethanolamine N-methyltransferase [Exidia glandulosa HHB12029]|uniref:Phosphatidylethanolamine N-methyltransferase n=1 Tax=Exidia glandulosa HHB12029 TaxID=1314781 RepID=A0A165IN57_EXIGL|nr:phosphatidylethanolamine N-methyltransferase [Exidia glandulosa HHB12029]